MRDRLGVVCAIGFTLLCCCGNTAPTGCTTQQQPPPSHVGAEVAGVAIVTGVVVGTIVLIHVHHTHHTLKGCVYASPEHGLQLLNEGDKKTYQLDGITSTVKPGDRFSLHGSRLKRQKDVDEQTFTVQQVKRDYGACKAPVTP